MFPLALNHCTVQNTKIILVQAIEGDVNKERILIKLCTDIAEAYLKTKVNKHSLLLGLAFPTLRDFAIDSIAELFERKENRLIKFEAWIDSEEIEQGSDLDIFIKIRRLVFSRVNDHLFTSYKEFDPALSKIIRNVKRGLREAIVEGLTLSKDGNAIVFGEEERDHPQMPFEILSIKFSSAFQNITSTVHALQCLRTIFEREDEYMCRVHCISFALLIRENYTALHKDEIELEGYTPNYLNGETEGIIKSQVSRTQKDLYPSYVLKRKLTEADFSGYFMVVEQIMISMFNENEHSGKGFFEQFNGIYTSVDKETYRRQHRSFIEYFVKKTRENVIQYLKNEHNSAKTSFR